MILKNRYKEQMSKISVDDEMKKRVMNKIRETQVTNIFMSIVIYLYNVYLMNNQDLRFPIIAQDKAKVVKI